MIEPTDLRDIFKWEYELVGRAPLMWFSTANALARAADTSYERFQKCRAIWESSFRRETHDGPLIPVGRPLTKEQREYLRDGGHGGVALMLLGFAIENVAKCILIARNPSLIDREGGLDEQLRTHDLVDLACSCRCPLNTDQTRALSVLTEYAVWAGRYPVPLRAVPRDQSRPGHGYWAKQRMGPITAIWKQARPVLGVLLDIAANEA